MVEDLSSPSGRIILTAIAPNGDALALVSYSDGSCSLTCGGELIPGLNWKPCDIAESTKLLLELAQVN